MMNVTYLIKTIETLVPNMEVSVNHVQKGNVPLTGISIGSGDIRPFVYMEHFDDEYKKSGYIGVAREMIEICKNAVTTEFANNINTDEISTWRYVKNRLRLCIAPKGTNPECVVYPYLDLELYIRVVIDASSKDMASYRITEAMLERWGITRRHLIDCAVKCTKPLYNVKSMEEMMYEMTGEVFFLEESVPMIVAHTTDNLHGASVMYCKDILKFIANKWEDDVVIIPSSIHECLLVPLQGMDTKEVTDMIREVNRTAVSSEERLSNHSYVFHRDTNEITY